jgi:hypothetical protein
VLVKASGFSYIRILQEIDVAESSPVLRPANTDAVATGVKAADATTAAPSTEPNKETKDGTDADSHDGLRFKERTTRAHDALSGIVQDWKGIAESEKKEGRAISDARKKRIETLRDGIRGMAKDMGSLADELDALLAEATPAPKEEETPADDSAKGAVDAQQKTAQDLHAHFLAIESHHLTGAS